MNCKLSALFVLVCVLLACLIRVDGLSQLGDSLGLTFKDSPSSAVPTVYLSRLVGDEALASESQQPNSNKNDNVRQVLFKELDADGNPRGPQPSSELWRLRQITRLIDELSHSISMRRPKGGPTQARAAEQRQHQQQRVPWAPKQEAPPQETRADLRAIGQVATASSELEANHSRPAFILEQVQSNTETSSRLEPEKKSSSSMGNHNAPNVNENGLAGLVWLHTGAASTPFLYPAQSRRNSNAGALVAGLLSSSSLTNPLVPRAFMQQAQQQAQGASSGTSSLTQSSGPAPVRPHSQLGAEEFALHSPVHIHAPDGFGYKRVETSRWNNLRGMWGKRSINDPNRPFVGKFKKFVEQFGDETRDFSPAKSPFGPALDRHAFNAISFEAGGLRDTFLAASDNESPLEQSSGQVIKAM